ncbi:MAG: sugar ABC transporter permease [Lachnospiraceae bacterium]|nr:sugar ABC transporter permease [Lachnospiraceae bacterium]
MSKITKRDIKENLTGWAFIGLNLLGYLLFKLLPLFLAGVLSFTKWNIAASLDTLQFVGFGNFSRIFHDPVFWESFWNTILYAIVMVPIAIGLSLVLAVILDTHVFGKGLLRLAFYLPNISSMVAVSVVWMILFIPSYGPINSILMSLGIDNPPKWLNATSTSLLSIIIIGVWQRLGYNIIIILAGLQGVSKSLYEAAEIDGANGIQKFFYITIPSLSNTMFFLTMISFISSFQMFTPVQVMTKGGPGTSSSVLVYYIYKAAFQNNDIGGASAMAWVLFLLVFVFSAARMIVSRKKES